MLSNFLSIGQQILIIFLIALLGFIAGKVKLVDSRETDGMARLVVTYVAPAMIIMAFQRPFEAKLLKGFLLTMGIAFLCYLVSIVLAHLLIRSREQARRSVLRCAAVFSNCGMISLPLQSALFGNDGVFYGAAFIAAFNLVFWTYGALEMGRSQGKVEVAKILLNPGLLGTIVGLILFFTSTTLPAVPASALNYISGLNVPLSMLVIGQRLSVISIRSLFGDRGVWGTVAARLVVTPVVLALVLRAAGITGTIGICAVIAAAAPAAASITMLAITYGQDTELAAKTVSLHAILSVLTMPVIITLAYGLLM